MILLIRLMLVVVLALVIWRLLRDGLTPARRSGDAPGGATPQYQATQRCANCGTHVPGAEIDGSGRCARCRGQVAG